MPASALNSDIGVRVIDGPAPPRHSKNPARIARPIQVAVFPARRYAPLFFASFYFAVRAPRFDTLVAGHAGEDMREMSADMSLSLSRPYTVSSIPSVLSLS